MSNKFANKSLLLLFLYIRNLQKNNKILAKPM